jgi:hypothetical protein
MFIKESPLQHNSKTSSCSPSPDVPEVNGLFDPARPIINVGEQMTAALASLFVPVDTYIQVAR